MSTTGLMDKLIKRYALFPAHSAAEANEKYQLGAVHYYRAPDWIRPLIHRHQNEPELSTLRFPNLVAPPPMPVAAIGTTGRLARVETIVKDMVQKYEMASGTRQYLAPGASIDANLMEERLNILHFNLCNAPVWMAKMLDEQEKDKYFHAGAVVWEYLVPSLLQVFPRKKWEITWTDCALNSEQNIVAVIWYAVRARMLIVDCQDVVAKQDRLRFYKELDVVINRLLDEYSEGAEPSSTVVTDRLRQNLEEYSVGFKAYLAEEALGQPQGQTNQAQVQMPEAEASMATSVPQAERVDRAGGPSSTPPPPRPAVAEKQMVDQTGGPSSAPPALRPVSPEKRKRDTTLSDVSFDTTDSGNKEESSAPSPKRQKGKNGAPRAISRGEARMVGAVGGLPVKPGPVIGSPTPSGRVESGSEMDPAQVARLQYYARESLAAHAAAGINKAAESDGLAKSSEKPAPPRLAPSPGYLAHPHVAAQNPGASGSSASARTPLPWGKITAGGPKAFQITTSPATRDVARPRDQALAKRAIEAHHRLERERKAAAGNAGSSRLDTPMIADPAGRNMRMAENIRPNVTPRDPIAGPSSTTPAPVNIGFRLEQAARRLGPLPARRSGFVAINDPLPDEDTDIDVEDDSMADSSAIADSSAVTESSSVPKVNDKTKRAHEKGDYINEHGTPAPEKCIKCRPKEGMPCVVYNLDGYGVSCGNCVKTKEKCSFQLAIEADAFEAEGTRFDDACDKCKENGTEYRCYKPTDKQIKSLSGKWACSQCMRLGRKDKCSLGANPKRYGRVAAVRKTAGVAKVKAKAKAKGKGKMVMTSGSEEVDHGHEHDHEVEEPEPEQEQEPTAEAEMSEKAKGKRKAVVVSSSSELSSPPETPD